MQTIQRQVRINILDHTKYLFSPEHVPDLQTQDRSSKVWSARSQRDWWRRKQREICSAKEAECWLETQRAACCVSGNQFKSYGKSVVHTVKALNNSESRVTNLGLVILNGRRCKIWIILTFLLCFQGPAARRCAAMVVECKLSCRPATVLFKNDQIGDIRAEFKNLVQTELDCSE